MEALVLSFKEIRKGLYQVLAQCPKCKSKNKHGNDSLGYCYRGCNFCPTDYRVKF